MKTNTLRIFRRVLVLTLLLWSVSAVQSDDASDLAQAQKERDDWYAQQAQAQKERDDWYAQQAQAQKDRDAWAQTQKDREDFYKQQAQTQKDRNDWYALQAQTQRDSGQPVGQVASGQVANTRGIRLEGPIVVPTQRAVTPPQQNTVPTRSYTVTIYNGTVTHQTFVMRNDGTWHDNGNLASDAPTPAVIASKAILQAKLPAQTLPE